MSVSDGGDDDLSAESEDLGPFSAWFIDQNGSLPLSSTDSLSGEEFLSQYVTANSGGKNAGVGEVFEKSLVDMGEFPFSPMLNAPPYPNDDVCMTALDQQQYFGLDQSTLGQKGWPSNLGNPIERNVQELAELNISICRSAQLITTWNLGQPLSVNSPFIDGLLSATNSLVSVVDQIARQPSDCEVCFGDLSFEELRRMEDNQPRRKTSMLLENGVALLVLSCHQQLLAAFEKIYAGIHCRLTKNRPSLSRRISHGHAHENTGLDLLDQSALASSATAQSVMIVKLLKHLTCRLDRALDPIAECLKNQGVSDEMGRNDENRWSLFVDRRSTPSPMISNSTASIDVSPSKDETIENDRGAESSHSSTNADTAMVRLVLDTMQCRRIRLKVRMREVKALIRSSGMP